MDKIDVQNHKFKKDLSQTKREQLIIEMFNKYNEYKTLEKVAKDYGYTRERVRQYFVLGNKLGIIDYKPFNRESFQNIKNEISKEKLIDLFCKYGTVRSICENTGITVSHANRLVKLYDVTISPLRKQYLKNKIIQEYREIVDENGGKNLSTYDLLSIKNGRNLWARIARTWGTFKEFKEDQNIVLDQKTRRKSPLEFDQEAMSHAEDN